MSVAISGIALDDFKFVGYKPSADLAEADVSIKTEKWTGKEDEDFSDCWS